MLVILFLLLSTAIYSQNIAIFPEVNKDLVYIEAEEALVTNFATSPTLNYSASGQRTLQLNTYNNRSSGYFAEFVVYIEEEGEYSFWYGGTPPGTNDDLYPSYSSPFSLNIDESDTKLYREDVNVVENYAPGLYWVKTKDIELTKGYHNISFRITDKRGFDGKYYFYIDSFFLFKGDEETPGLTPDIFPKNMTDRSIDQPFNTISYYQNSIKASPEQVGDYMSLAYIYILIGDFFNSIKMLNRVLQIDPQNQTARLLMAKTRIWNGDIDTGLAAYETFLNQYPENPDIWGEAGKIAAWVSKYDKSLTFYSNGLSVYPNNVSLIINKAFTHLWKGDIEEGLNIIGSIKSNIERDSKKIKKVSDTFYVNGYPNYAIDYYNASINQYPELIELYLYLDNLYHLTDNDEESQKLNSRIKENFIITEELEKILDLSKKKKNLKSSYIRDLEEKVNIDPENLEARELLVQTYFWNGMTKESILEYKKIVATYNLNEMEVLLEDSKDLIVTYNTLKRMLLTLNNIKNDRDNIRRNFFNSIIGFRTSIAKYKKNGSEDNFNTLMIEQKKVNENLKEMLAITEILNYINIEYSFLKEKISELGNNENEEQDFFNKLISGSNWHFNSKFLTNELIQLKESNYLEADYLLTAIKLFEGDYIESTKYSEYLDKEYYKNNYLVYLNNLWSGNLNNSNIEDVIIYFPHLEGEFSFTQGLNAIEVPKIEISQEDIEGYNKYVIVQADAIKKVNLLLEDVKLKENEIKKHLNNKLTRAMYRFEENTYLTRYTIGDYYLQEENYNEALLQFQQVTLFDPLNISANFKLGRLQQLTGNWLEAMETYNGVFSVDPEFQNAASMYNQLSRNHPEITSGDLKYFVDTGRIQYIENIYTNFNFTSNLMATIDWTSNTLNFYKSTNNRPAIDFRVDDYRIFTNIMLFNKIIDVKPVAGVSVYNENFTHTPNFINTDFNEVMTSNIVFPIVGINSNFKLGQNLQLTVNYNYRKLLESNPIEVLDTRNFSQEYQISGYYPLSFENLNSFSFRSYFKLDTNTDKNINNYIYTGVQDLIIGFILVRNPWTILNLYSSTSFESSTNTDIENYYTPNDVFVSKIGATFGSWLGIGNGVLGLNFRLAPGLYINKLLSSSESSFTGDFDIEVNYSKNNRLIFMKLYGSGTFSTIEEADYWSFQASIGIRLNLYKLLAL